MCLLCSASYRESGARCPVIQEPHVVACNLCVLVWNVGVMSRATNTSKFSSKEWDQLHNFQISSAVWKSASSYFQSADSSEWFSTEPPHHFLPTNHKIGRTVVFVGKGPHVYLVPSSYLHVCILFYFILLYLHKISVWYITSSLFYKGGNWISGNFSLSPFVV